MIFGNCMNDSVGYYFKHKKPPSAQKRMEKLHYIVYPVMVFSIVHTALAGHE
jgi:hypothetical protein